jgi:hypothetical protein
MRARATLGRALTVLAVMGALLLGAVPAHATTPPPECHYTAGKVAAQTSTLSRKIDVRWPGMTCAGSVVSTGVKVQVLYQSGKSWLFYTTAYRLDPAPLVLPAGSVHASCPHLAVVKARIIYVVHFATATTQSYLVTNLTRCS